MLEEVQFCVIEEFGPDRGVKCVNWQVYLNVLEHLFGIYLKTNADATYVIFRMDGYGNEERIKGILLEIAHLYDIHWGLLTGWKTIIKFLDLLRSRELSRHSKQ